MHRGKIRCDLLEVSKVDPAEVELAGADSVNGVGPWEYPVVWIHHDVDRFLAESYSLFKESCAWVVGGKIVSD